MKKIVFTWLLLSFFISPFVNIIGNDCYGGFENGTCQMLEDTEAHDNNLNHCQGCHLSINFLKIQTFNVSDMSKDSNALILKESFSVFDTYNNLYKPPIA